MVEMLVQSPRGSCAVPRAHISPLQASKREQDCSSETTVEEENFVTYA